MLFLLLSLAVMGYASFSLLQVGGRGSGDFQRLWLAPEQVSVGQAGSEQGAEQPKINSGLKAARETVQGIREELLGACDPMTLFAIASPASVSVQDGASAAARLEALEEDAYALRPIELFGGRLMYAEEFERGDRVAMLDEQLAVALFQYAEPLEREVLIAGKTYRIVGIVRDQKQVGDAQDYSVYVPYRAIEKSSLPLHHLCLQAAPVAGAGGWSAFSAATAALGSGTTWNLQKEITNALMPARMLLVLCGVVVLFALLRHVNAWFWSTVGAYERRLKDAYAARLLPWLAGRGLLLLLGYGVLLYGFAQVFLLWVSPVYLFPEWIPAVLVEPKDIAAAFWNVWQGMASPMELRSPEVLRIQFFARLLAWATGGAAAAAGVLWGRWAAARGRRE